MRRVKANTRLWARLLFCYLFEILCNFMSTTMTPFVIVIELPSSSSLSSFCLQLTSAGFWEGTQAFSFPSPLSNNLFRDEKVLLHCNISNLLKLNKEKCLLFHCFQWQTPLFEHKNFIIYNLHANKVDFGQFTLWILASRRISYFVDH